MTKNPPSGARTPRKRERTRTLFRRGTEAEALEQEAARLRREKRLILEQREEHTELMRAVESERTLAERKASAGVLTQAKWWLVGRKQVSPAIREHESAATAEVTEAVGVTRQGADYRLRRLEEQGEVRHKKAGNSLIWFVVNQEGDE